MVAVFFFFFQAEDGIRDLTVTGVQTCALPIFVAAVNPGSRLALYSRPNGNPVGVLSSRTVYGGPLKLPVGRTRGDWLGGPPAAMPNGGLGRGKADTRAPPLGPVPADSRTHPSCRGRHGWAP